MRGTPQIPTRKLLQPIIQPQYQRGAAKKACEFRLPSGAVASVPPLYFLSFLKLCFPPASLAAGCLGSGFSLPGLGFLSGFFWRTPGINAPLLGETKDHLSMSIWHLRVPEICLVRAPTSGSICLRACFGPYILRFGVWLGVCKALTSDRTCKDSQVCSHSGLTPKKACIKFSAGLYPSPTSEKHLETHAATVQPARGCT